MSITETPCAVPASTARPGSTAGPGSTMLFVRRAVRDQATVGAVAPSAPAVCRAMAALVPTRPGLTVLELGAGTGAVSAAIGERLGHGARHVAVERDPELLAVLRRTAPWAERVAGDAAGLTGLLRAAAVPGADVVLSTLPWSYFDAARQRRILGQIVEVLAPGGVFATVALRPTRMMPRSRRFRATLRATFGEVVTTSTVWRNLPPARLYVCRDPYRRGQADE